MNPLRLLGRALGPPNDPDRSPPGPNPAADPPTDPHGWPAARHDPDPALDPFPPPQVSRPPVSLPHPTSTLEAHLGAAAAAGAGLLATPGPASGAPPPAPTGRAPTGWGPGGPVPGGPAPSGPAPSGPAPPGRGPIPWPSPEPAGAALADAVALAVAFAVDLLSWDEADPARRGQVLTGYLSPGPDPALLGWDGTGRQRAEFAVPGRATPGPDGRLLVDVRVRVTPYRSVRSADPDPEPEATDGIPAAAPAPTARGWRGLAARWIRLTVPVIRAGERMVIARMTEPVGADDPAATPADPDPAAPAADDAR